MDKNANQKNSSAYRLAALDPDFLLGDSTRGVRLQLEYEKAEERLRAWVVRSTIVVFGSARVRPRGNSHEAESTATLWPGAMPPPATNRRGGMKRRGASGGSRPSEVARSDRAVASAIM